MLKNKGFSLGVFLIIFVLPACGGGKTSQPPQVPGSSINVEITKDYCPSIEAQADMQISWTNNDTVDRVLWIEHKDEQGTVVDTGGTDQLQPGSTFSITLLMPGEYTYYCSKDRTAFGMITITP